MIANQHTISCGEADAVLVEAGWILWPGFPNAELQGKIKNSNLRVEVWERKEPRALAVAFGGTVFTSWKDWMSNLRWFIPGHPVTQVYAFDPSPVTGFYSVDTETRDSNKKNLLIDRIYERGEIVAILRSFTSFFYPPSSSEATIRAVRYNLFDAPGPFSDHSMTPLACGLKNAAGHAGSS